jgi:hypothetical protein
MVIFLGTWRMLVRGLRFQHRIGKEIASIFIVAPDEVCGADGAEEKAVVLLE